MILNFDSKILNSSLDKWREARKYYKTSEHYLKSAYDRVNTIPDRSELPEELQELLPTEFKTHIRNVIRKGELEINGLRETTIPNIIAWIKDKIDSFEAAESNSRDVSNSISGGASVAGISGSTSSGSSKASAGSSSGSSSISSGSSSGNSTSAKVGTKVKKVKEAKQISSKVGKVKEGIGNNITDPEEMQKVIPDEPTTSVGVIGDAVNGGIAEPCSHSAGERGDRFGRTAEYAALGGIQFRHRHVRADEPFGGIISLFEPVACW